jgi:hypothetical protein
MAKETILNRSWKRVKKSINFLLHYWTVSPDKKDEAVPAIPSFKPLAFHPVLEEEVGKLTSPEALPARVPQKADGNTIVLPIFRRRPDPADEADSHHNGSTDTNAAAPSAPLRPCILDLHAGGMVAVHDRVGAGPVGGAAARRRVRQPRVPAGAGASAPGARGRLLRGAALGRGRGAHAGRRPRAAGGQRRATARAPNCAASCSCAPCWMTGATRCRRGRLVFPVVCLWFPDGVGALSKWVLCLGWNTHPGWAGVYIILTLCGRYQLLFVE